jgi:hypothetical protein
MALRLSPALATKLAGDNINLLTNPDFTSVTTGWTAVTATLTSSGSGQSGNCLRVAETGSADPGQAYQDVATRIGHLYKFSGYFKKGTADSGKFLIGTAGALWDSGSLTDAAWALHTGYFVAIATTTRITCQSTDATAAEYSEFDTLVLECESHSLQDIMHGGEIKVYTGTQPATADLAPTGTLLVTIKNGGAGLTLGDAVAWVIAKAVAETWSGVCGNTGTAAWFRFQHDDDLETANSTDCRLDGTVATSGGQLNFTSTTFSTGATETVTAFSVTFPTA